MTKKTPLQIGFTLVELMITVAISTMLLAAGVWIKNELYQIDKATSQGTHLATLTNSVGTYATVYHNNLVNNTAIAGYTNIYAPTIAELRTAGYVPANFNATSDYGFAYSIAVARYPTGCTAPNCDITILVCVNGSITDPRSGLVDGPALGSAAQKAGQDAGYSTPSVPGTITGLAAAWTTANPAGNVPGVLCMRAGYGSSGWSQFLRRDSGDAGMTGNLKMGGNDITNAAAVNSVTLNNTGNATVGGNLGVTGSSTLAGITNNGNLTNTGNITNSGALATGNTTITGTVNVSGNATLSGNTTVGGTLGVSGLTTTAGITNTGTISNTGNITTTGDVTTGRLKLNTIVVNNSSCTGLNGYQAATAAGSIASCINGVWTTPNASTAVPPPCSSQSITWGSTSGCSATLPATVSGSTATVSANSPNSGSATFSCTSGTWSFQSGSCSMQCSAQTLTWGSGCQASFPATAGGSSATRSATNSPYSGSATYSCNSTNGTWSFSSGSCTAPSPCSGSVSWGNGNCSSTYSLSSGSSSWLSYSGSNTYAGYNLSGSISGSAFASCNNGSLSVSSKSCNYSGSYPQAYNSTGGSGSAPMTVYIVSAATGAYCSHLLGSGTSSSYSTTSCPNDNWWFTWSNRVTDMSWSAMVAGNGCSTNGCSCYAWRTGPGSGGYANVVTSLSCTNNN